MWHYVALFLKTYKNLKNLKKSVFFEFFKICGNMWRYAALFWEKQIRQKTMYFRVC